MQGLKRQQSEVAETSNDTNDEVAKESSYMVAEEARELTEEYKLISRAATQAALEHIRTHCVQVNLRQLKPKVVASKKRSSKTKNMVAEESSELVRGSESELLSKAATQAAMEHIRTGCVRVNLSQLKPEVERQVQEVVLVSSKRSRAELAGNTTKPFTEGAVMERMRTHAAKLQQSPVSVTHLHPTGHPDL